MTAAALATTVGIAAVSWALVLPPMMGTEMSPATLSGSFISFIVMWILMMAAMMLPGATPVVLDRAHACGRVRSILHDLPQQVNGL